jgi:predicted CoA-binding protein
MKKKVKKKVKLNLVGLDGNAWALMGAFSNAARKQGWTKEEIKGVMDECMSSDYDHLLATLIENTQ